jgi:ABC-type uncharacterized transport system permease subunit
MLSGISITCFAASYAVALILEVTRLLFRSGVRGAIMLGFAGAGLLAHTLFLVHRALTVPGSPLSSELDWYLVAAWVLVAFYLYLIRYHPKTPFGLLLLPLALGLIGTAAVFADRMPFERAPASQIWGAIHGGSILVATVSVLIGFAAGVTYLYQARRLKHKRPPSRGLRLPSLEWLQRVNSRALIVSMLALGVGVLSGLNLNLLNYRRQQAMLPWTDPLVLATLGMFAWLAISVQLGALYKPARAGRKVAFVTVVSLLFLIIALAAMLFMNTQHGGTRRAKETGAGEKRAEDRGQWAVEWAQGSGFRVQDDRRRVAACPPICNHQSAILNLQFCPHSPLPTLRCPLPTLHSPLSTPRCPLPPGASA